MELTRGLVSSVVYATSHSSTQNWLLRDLGLAWCVKGVDINNIGIQYLFHFLSPCQFTVLTLPIYRSRSYIILLDMVHNCLINSKDLFWIVGVFHANVRPCASGEDISEACPFLCVCQGTWYGSTLCSSPLWWSKEVKFYHITDRLESEYSKNAEPYG